jgi:hypothetical protein
METRLIDVLLKVAGALEKLNIPYAIVGSFASSIHGIPRSTNDADVLAAIKPEHAKAFVSDLRGEFYADEQTIEQAVRSKQNFDVVHFDSIFKVDVFVSKPDRFEAMQMERRQLEVLKPDPQQTAYVATAEDTILAKLVWYRDRRGISDMQWRDILGVIRVQGDKLDLAYLGHWAAELQVTDLLARAME